MSTWNRIKLKLSRVGTKTSDPKVTVTQDMLIKIALDEEMQQNLKEELRMAETPTLKIPAGSNDCKRKMAHYCLISTWTKNFQMYKPGFEEAEEPETILLTFIGSCQTQGNSRKTTTSASLTTLKPLTVWITTNCGKFLNRWEYQTMLPVFWETCTLVKKEQLELDMEQQIGSKLRKEYDKAIYCHPAFLTYM